MRIKSIETFTRGHLSVVRVKTDDGAEGYGQIAPYNADISALVLHRQVARHALGQDALDIDAVVDRCIEGEHKFPGTYVCRAVGGIDTALWDLKGKLEDKGVSQLLGGTKKFIEVYGSSMSRTITPADEAMRLARLMDQKGFRAFKVRIGMNFGHDVDAWPGRTEELIPTLRKEVGNGVALYVDANSGYSPEKAIAVGRMLEEYGVCHFEEPCPYWELEWTARVTEALDVPVAGGEQDNSLPTFKRMVEMPAVDIIQPDICYIGGLARALRAAKMAELNGMPCTPHAANRSMVTVFTLHMVGAIPNAGPFMEYSIEDDPWVEGLFDPPLEVKDGKVMIPQGPGWGVTIRQDWLEKADYKISSID